MNIPQIFYSQQGLSTDSLIFMVRYDYPLFIFYLENSLYKIQVHIF